MEGLLAGHSPQEFGALPHRAPIVQCQGTVWVGARGIWSPFSRSEHALAAWGLRVLPSGTCRGAPGPQSITQHCWSPLHPHLGMFPGDRDGLCLLHARLSLVGLSPHKSTPQSSSRVVLTSFYSYRVWASGRLRHRPRPRGLEALSLPATWPSCCEVIASQTLS